MDRSERRWRTAATACGLAATLSACKLHDQVEASRHGGTVMLADADRHEACLNGLEVSSRTDGIVWKVAAREGSVACAAKFPLVYGAAPEGLVETRPAQPLRSGTDYEVKGTGSAHYFGAFRLLPGGQVQNRWTEY
jgi:hypothetical protein